MNLYQPNPYYAYGQPTNYSQPVAYPQPAPQQYYLNGKIVDSEDMARIQEIPIGSYGVFPKSDMTAIYVKAWNNDGTTKLVQYVPVVNQRQSDVNDRLDDIYKYLNAINEKLDGIRPPKSKDGGKHE